MTGRIGDARSSWSRALELYRELGIMMTAYMMLGWAELSGGDPARAEGPLREGLEVLEAAGEKGFFGTTAAVLAEVLWANGKDEEAERYPLLSEEIAVSDDWITQYQWRASLSKVMADRAELSQAETLARAAVSVIDRTEYVMSRGDARVSLAYVLRKAGRPEEAAAALREALEIYERKGDVADAAKARAELEALQSS
jgi:tetratricopeptide (TPR) repeat protein